MVLNKGVVVASCVAMCGVANAQNVEGPETVQDKIRTIAKKGMESFQWGLLVEAEGAYGRVGREDSSDITLATVSFTADAAANDWLSGHIGLLWEEDDTEENNLDEAYLSFGCSEQCSFYAKIGRFYLPFGNYETAFISDSAPLELGEICESSGLLGYESRWIGLQAGAFKGEEEEVVENLYLAVLVHCAEGLEVGAYWLSDLLETAGLEDLNDDLSQKEGGAGVYLNGNYGSFSVNAEFMTASSDLPMGGREYCPAAYAIEASMSFGDRWNAGLKVLKIFIRNSMELV